MVYFEETNNHGDIVEKIYPSRLLGFITANGKQEAVVQCSVHPIEWDTIQWDFIVAIELGQNFNISFVIIPTESIVHPLCVLPNDGNNTHE
jgi:hypothetical protein